MFAIKINICYNATMRKNIDDNIEQVYNFINDFVSENGYPPSVREICGALSIKSTATAYYYIEKLKDRGMIQKNPTKNRTLSTLSNKTENRQTFKVAPLIGTITAGQPILATENYDGFYPLSSEFENYEESFVLNVQGDSMIEAGIFSGDKIIVNKQQSAENGEIIVALIDDSSTVKRFFKRNGKIILHPENSAYSDILLDDVQILGKVVGLIRKI